MHSGTFWNILHSGSGTLCMHSGTFRNILEHSGTFPYCIECCKKVEFQLDETQTHTWTDGHKDLLRRVFAAKKALYRIFFLISFFNGTL